MSDLERDIAEARAGESTKKYTTEEIEQARREAAKVISKYEEDMKKRAVEDFLNDRAKDYLYA